MDHRRLLLFFCFIFLGFKAFPAVFVVTSNADSGPGTLREALTLAAANGSSVKDYINFNLSDTSLTGRTISLLSQLPDLSSNLVIDGSTQPGSKFGVSDAKVKITNRFVYPNNINTFYSNGGDLIEIYGLWLWNDMTGWGGSAIHVRNFGTITIGAPTKGNLIEWGNIGIDTGKTCYIQNNICWADTTGEISAGGNMSVMGCSQLIIGGSVNTGNTFAGFLNLFFSDSINTSSFEVSYNNLGVDRTGLVSPASFYVEHDRLDINGPYLNNGQPAYVPVNGVIKNNIIANAGVSSLLSIAGVNGKIVVQGNAFNTDFSGKTNFSLKSPLGPFNGIAFIGIADVIVGGDTPSQKNIIAYCEDGINYTPQNNFMVTKNSIYCYADSALFITKKSSPYVKINSVTGGNISGTASPNASIELFTADCSCTIPGPKDYFATAQTDKNGNWSYNGVVDGFIMASATLDSLTGSFSGLNIDDSHAIIVNSTCANKGSITGLVTPYSSDYQWFNSKNQLVGTNLDLIDVVPDTYTLKIENGTACALTKTFTIKDFSIYVDTTNIKYVRPSCNSSGSITGITATSISNLYYYQWVDQAGKILCKCTDLNNVSAGSYTFEVGNFDGTCQKSYGPFILSNVSGPNIDQSGVVIQSTNCGQSTGSITSLNVTGTGTLQYIWWNSQQQTVSTTKDLLNQPAGIYKLQVTDDSQCGAIYSTDITIPETNGVTLDDSSVQIKVAGCSSNNGSITGLQITGATAYQWVDANNKTVGTLPDLQNVAAGNYTLTASNTFGCSITSKTYHIALQAPTQYPVYPSTIYLACTGKSNGGVNVPVDTLVHFERWADALGQTVGTGIGVSNVPAGVYQLYLTDGNGCETLYNTYIVPSIPQLVIQDGSGQVSNEQCSIKDGSIKDIQISGGRPPFTYAWLDTSNNKIATTLDITGLSAGTYTFTVNDGTTCGVVSATYTIQNQDVPVPAPVVNNLQVCGSGEVMLRVKNPSALYSYRLYDSNSGPNVIDEQATGVFKINVKTNTTFYVSQFSGSCESSRSEVQVSVGITSVDIANTFTPNGDGINDYWKIADIENYPNAIVQVFTRYGEKVFESKGYAKPFDGTYNGGQLPTGVYYYIVNLGNACSLITGSLTIIR